MSQDASKSRGLVRGVAVAVVVAVALLAADILLTWALVPASGQTEVVRSEWRALADSGYDTIVIGSSYAQHDVYPDLLDEELGSNTFNAATPFQSRHAALASVRDAVENHGVRRVILGGSVTNLETNTVINYDIAFTLAEAEGKGLLGGLGTYLGLLTDSNYFGTNESIAALAPWSLNKVGFSPSAIRQNVADRLSGGSATDIYARYGGDPYLGDGFFRFEGTISVNDVSLRAFDAPDTECEPIPEVIAEYEEIAAYCEQHDVSFYYVITPRPAYSTLRFGPRYTRIMSVLKDLTEGHGGTFIDFNLAHPGLLDLDQDTDFSDLGHLNYGGAVKFTPVLGQVLAACERGDAWQEQFFSYDEWDAYVASVDNLSLATFAHELSSEAITMTGQAYTGSDVDVEYLFEVRAPGQEDFATLRDWGADPTCVYPIDAHGQWVTIRMTARIVGVEDQPLRTCEKRLLT